MYFEKIISNHDTKKLLKVSESYRNMNRAAAAGDVLSKTENYYNKFINILGTVFVSKNNRCLNGTIKTAIVIYLKKSI